MECTETLWHGFTCMEFIFDNSPAKVVKPNVTPNGKWALKTEYFDAFPSTEIELLNRGWHIAFQKNDNRWAGERDLARKAEFVRFVGKNFNLEEKCTMVGMSCGGMYAVLLAARIPSLTDVLYLDAPVLNLLSCPCDMGIAQSGLYEEFYSRTNLTKSDMLSYRKHPIDYLSVLTDNNIPVVLVAGDSDTVVPYVENGAVLADFYSKHGGVISVHIKEGCNHHPHGLENYVLIADEIEQMSKGRKN